MKPLKAFLQVARWPSLMVDWSGKSRFNPKLAVFESYMVQVPSQQLLKPYKGFLSL
jgi:hypothetical protein